MKLSQLNSGYLSEAKSWENFIKCWNVQSSELEQGERFIYLGDSASGAASTREQIQAFREKFGFKMSKSIEDFYTNYSKLGGMFLKKNNTDERGIFSIQDIDYLKSFYPDIVNVAEDLPFESSDEQYFQYGVAQDTATGRTSNLSNAVVIGRYGYSDYELILVYPQSKTKDGEFETAILSHGYEFRAPSFAEMMRQLNVLDTVDENLMPPYSQESLKGTCAGALPLQSVWWE